MDVTREQVKDFLKNMSLLDASALVKELEVELGVSAAAPMVVAAAGPAAATATGAAAETPSSTSSSFTSAEASRRLMFFKKSFTCSRVTSIGSSLLPFGYGHSA